MKKQNMIFLLAALLASCGGVDSSTFEEEPSSSTQIEESETPTKSESPSETPTESESPSETQSPTEKESESSTDLTSEESSSPIEVTTPFHKEKNITHYLGSDNDVYRINITTENNEFPVDKENYVKGSLNVTEQDNSKVFQEDMNMRIKLRGNSTLAADKKPFKIKFDEKQSMFGLEKAKDWVLLANYYDKSNIRNYLAYLTANKLTNLDFQPSSIFVDVYFNNEYIGLYLLCEQIEAKKGRVSVDKNFSEDGVSSFLLEADERAKDEYKGFQGSCYVTSGRYDFALKGPDADDYVEAFEIVNDPSSSSEDIQEANETLAQFNKDTAWLQAFMDKTSEAIYSNKGYEDYIDVDSFIDFYLVQEFFKNVDVGSTSQFYVIDQADETVKLKAGPVWDFDISAGVVDDSSGIYTAYHHTDLFMKYRDYYCNALFEDQSFYEAVSERYSEVRDDVFLSVFEEMKLVESVLAKAQERNIKRWPITDKRSTWIEVNAYADYYLKIKTLDGQYTLLEDFLNERLAILDKAYIR